MAINDFYWKFLKIKKKKNEFINMMPLIAAGQNTQLADFFSGLKRVYKKMREFLILVLQSSAFGC
jgi:hypothetical protein